jgi:hypothetical protein
LADYFYRAAAVRAVRQEPEPEAFVSMDLAPEMTAKMFVAAFRLTERL